MELKPSGYGIVVDTSKSTMKYLLRGLNFPYGCSLNNDSDVEKYFGGKMPKNPEDQKILRSVHPNLYKKFNYVPSGRKNLITLIRDFFVTS